MLVFKCFSFPYYSACMRRFKSQHKNPGAGRYRPIIHQNLKINLVFGKQNRHIKIDSTQNEANCHVFLFYTKQEKNG